MRADPDCRVRLAGGVVLLLLCAGAAEADIVSRVELEGAAGGRLPAGLTELLTVEAGEELRPEQLRTSLRNLHASGLVGRAQARVIPERDGSRVSFSVHPRLQAGSVEIAGGGCLRESEMRNLLAQRPRTPLSESRIVRGVYRLQDLLAERGYLEAEVRVSVDRANDAAADVIYQVDCGEPTMVGRVTFTGEIGPFSEDELRRQIKSAPGVRFQRPRLAEDAERLESWLGARGHRAAEVGAPVERRDRDASSVDLDFPISVGPRIELLVSGYEVRLLRKRGLLSGLERERFDEALMLQTVERIRADLQRRGHYRALVRGEIADLEGRKEVRLFIDPGDVYTLERLDFEGNSLVPTSELVARMATTPERVFAAGSGRLSDDVLADDLDNLASHYALQGFARARIGPPRIEVDDRRHSIGVVVPIVEGPRRMVVETEFVGFTAFAPSRERLAISPGGPFHPRRVEDSVAELRARCEDLGYLSAQVAARVEWDPGGRLATVVIEALEGPRVTVDRIIVRGLTRLRSDVARRSLGLESGDPVSRRRLLEVQRELYRLGIFSRVEVRLAPAMPFAASRDVLVRLEEGRAQKGSLGVGYDSEDGLRALLGYSHSNLFGRAVATRFDLRLSERDRQARLLFRQPLLGRRRVPVTYSIFGVEEREESFESERRGVQIESEIERGSSRFGLLLTVKEVRVVDPDPALEAIEIDRELREVDIASLTPRFSVDRRDDPLVPTRGWTSVVQTEYAFPALSGSAEFVKLFAQQTAYRDLGRAGLLAASLRLGAIEPLGDPTPDPTVPVGLESALVPISERFFAGGRSTHRAYRRDLLGVPGETLLLVPDAAAGAQRRVPIGGNGLLLANIDYRFPVAGGVGGTLFFDAGNVFGQWDDISAAELELGAGVGVRYLSPIGPLRLEVGWKLDPGENESDAVVFLSFGNPF